MLPQKLRCLFRRHQWHNGWDAEKHEPVWTCKRLGRAGANHGSIGDSATRAGLTLIRVLREGLWFPEYLGRTVGRANGQNETASRTLSRNPGASSEANGPRSVVSWSPR